MASSYHIATLGVRLYSIKAEADNISQLITANQIEKNTEKISERIIKMKMKQIQHGQMLRLIG